MQTMEEDVERARHDPAAFGILYDRYVERIYRFIYARVHDRPLAEDITEEVFVKALKNIRSYRQMGCGFGPWLYRIAANAVADHYRSPERTLPLDVAGDQQAADDVAEQVARRDQVRELWQAVDRLPAKQRQAMLLRFSSDLSIADVARIMNRRPGAVKLLVFRGTRRVRQDLVPLEA